MERMVDNKHKQSIDSITKTWAIWLGICLLPIFLVFAYCGDPGRGQAAAICTGAIAIAARFVWDLRNRLWFWIAITMIVLLHIPLIVFISWPFTQLSYVALLPIALLDFGITYGIIRLLENTIGKPETTTNV